MDKIVLMLTNNLLWLYLMVPESYQDLSIHMDKLISI